MKTYNKRTAVCVNFYDDDTQKVIDFYNTHRYSHKEIYLRGIEGLEMDLLAQKESKKLQK